MILLETKRKQPKYLFLFFSIFPRHLPDEEGSIMTIIGRPPFLRIRHECSQISLDGLEVQLCEFVSVVESRASHRISLFIVLGQDFDVELFGPPIFVGGSVSWMAEWTLRHDFFDNFLFVCFAFAVCFCNQLKKIVRSKCSRDENSQTLFRFCFGVVLLG